MYSAVPKYKVVLTGEWGVGKSSLFQRFQNDTFTQQEPVPRSESRPSFGLDHSSKEFKLSNGVVELELWDTAGLERFESLSVSYFSQARAVIICYSQDVEASIQALSQHVLDATQLAENPLVFLCGNKRDIHPSQYDRSTSYIASEWGDEKIKRFNGDVSSRKNSTLEHILTEFEGVIEGAFEVSCKTGDSVNKMFLAVAKALKMKAVERTKTNERNKIYLTQRRVSRSSIVNVRKKCC